MNSTYKKVAKEVLQCVGGAENVISLTHCATRLRFKLVDKSKVQEEELKSIDLVVGVKPAPHQYQVIIGNEVNAIYKMILPKLGNSSKKLQQNHKQQKKKVTLFQSIIDVITGCMTPMIPVLTAAGMLKVILALSTQFNWVNTESNTYQLLTIIGDATFYFIPLMVAVFAAQKFNVTISLAVISAAVFIHPSFVGLVTSGNPIDFFHLPVASVGYAYSIIPTILTVWVMSYIEKVVDAITPNALKILLNPTLVMLITAPLALIIIGPIGFYAGEALAHLVEILQETFGIILIPLLAAAMPFIVMTGMHHALTPIFLSTFAITGYDSLILLAQVCANLAQGGAALAVGCKSKNVKTKQLGTASGISALMGITEPALYGINLKYKRPMIAAVIGAGFAGVFAGIMHVKILVLNNSILTALSMADSSTNLVNGLIMLAMSIFIPFILVYLLGFSEEK